MTISLRCGMAMVGLMVAAGCGASDLPPPEPAEPPAMAPSPPSEGAAGDRSAPNPTALPLIGPSSGPPSGPSSQASSDPPVPPASEPPSVPPTGSGSVDAPAPAVGPSHKAVPGANITMGEVTVDGVTVKSLSCRTGGGGLGALLGTLTLTAGISKRRAQLDRCGSPGKQATPIHWHQRGGKITKVTASGPDPKRNRCVQQALMGAVATQDAECMATVVHGT